MKKHTYAALALAASLGLVLTGCGSSDESADGKTKVTFGYIGDFNGTSLLAVADKEDLWDKAGLAVDLKVFTDGPTQIQALGAGSLDYGYIGPGAVWLPATGKASVISINTLGSADRVIAQPGITSMQDLKGKKVAVPEGTSGDMILGLALEKAGMTKDDIEVVPMDPATIVSAFGSGKVDAAGIFYPNIDTIKQQVPDLVELAQNSDFAPDVSFPNAFVGAPDAGSDPTTAKVVKVLREAMDYRAEHVEETIEDTADMLHQPVESVKADASHVELLTSAELDEDTADGTVTKWFDALQNFFVSSGKLDKPVDSSTFYLGDEFVAAGK